jgi:hypothetical protein
MGGVRAGSGTAVNRYHGAKEQGQPTHHSLGMHVGESLQMDLISGNYRLDSPLPPSRKGLTLSLPPKHGVRWWDWGGLAVAVHCVGIAQRHRPTPTLKEGHRCPARKQAVCCLTFACSIRHGGSDKI